MFSLISENIKEIHFTLEQGVKICISIRRMLFSDICSLEIHLFPFKILARICILILEHW